MNFSRGKNPFFCIDLHHYLFLKRDRVVLLLLIMHKVEIREFERNMRMPITVASINSIPQSAALINVAHY